MHYLIHFERPLGNGSQPEVRLVSHMRHPDKNLLKQARRAGVRYALVSIWEGDRTEERRLKRTSMKRLCPVCLGQVTFEELVLKGQSGATAPD